MRNLSAAFLDRLFDWTVSASARQTPETFRRAKRLALLDVTFLFWSVVFSVVYASVGSPRCALVTLSYTVWIVGSLIALRQGKSVPFATNVLCAGGCSTLVIDAIFSGGSLSPPLLWLGCAPVVAVITCKARWGAFWLLATLAMIAVLVGADVVGVQLANDLNASQFRMLYYAVVFGSVICQFVMVWVGIGIEQRARDALRESNRQLADARQLLDSLQQGFGFTLDEWTKLKREKQALEYALRCRGGDDRAIDRELDRLEAKLAKIEGDGHAGEKARHHTHRH